MTTPAVKFQLDRARTLFEQGETRGAHALLEGIDIDALSGDDAATAWAIRLAHMSLDHQVESVEDDEAQRRIDLLPPVRDIRGNAASLLSRHGDRTTAEAILRRMCRDDPGDHLSWFNLAITLADVEQFDEAEEALRRTIEIDRSFAPAYERSAIIRRDVGDAEAAAERYEQYLSLAPDDADARISLGIIYSDLCRYERAATEFETAGRRDPDYPPLLYNRGVLAARRDDRAAAEDILRRMKAVAPEDFLTHELDAMSESSQGRAWPAWEALQRAFDLALDEHARSHLVACALGILIKHDLRPQIDEVINDVFDNHCFDADILYYIRLSAGHRSDHARMFRILVEGRVTDDDLVPDAVTAEERPLGAYRSYHVIADNIAQACELAVEFERRIGQCSECRAAECEPIDDEAIKGYLGVARCGGLCVFPIDEV
jgi:tetratricopeptide (TPR) repeat protein